MSDKFEYGTGRRKTATARTRIYAGSGSILVNGRPYEEYFPRKTLQMIIRQPLTLCKVADKVEVRVNVAGGGVSGQQLHAAVPILGVGVQHPSRQLDQLAHVPHQQRPPEAQLPT